MAITERKMDIRGGEGGGGVLERGIPVVSRHSARWEREKEDMFGSE